MSDDRLSTLVGDLKRVRHAMVEKKLSVGAQIGRVRVERLYVGALGQEIVEWRSPEAHGMITAPTPLEEDA